MKISPVSSAANTVGSMPMGEEAPQTISQKMRSIRMKTNVTPGYEAPIQAPPPDASLTIPENNEASATSEATEPLSPQFAALAKQRRALQREREAFERERAASPAQTSGGGVDVARLKSDPLGVMLENGVTYQQLTDAVLANQNTTINPKEMEERLLKTLEGRVEERLSQRDEQMVNQFVTQKMSEAKALIAEGDEYEMIRATNGLKYLPDLMKAIYKQTGETPVLSSCLKDIEDQLFEDNQPLTKLKKMQALIAPEPALQTPPPQQQRQMRTLTNRDTASPALSRKARAMAAWNTSK